jgi:hypothetical protein
MRWRISRQHTLSGFEGTEEGGDAEDAVAADGSGAASCPRSMIRPPWSTFILNRKQTACCAESCH